jgi:GNAT superfamily N-acetyltransferase
MDVQLSRSGPEDRPEVEEFLQARVSRRVARRGELVDALDHPAVLARSAGRLVGVATYVVDGDDCEVLTLHAATRHAGIGTALLDTVQDVAREAGCARVWLVTTNDNIEALRFYQRRGFRLTALRPGAVDSSRELLKPEIPASGSFGIPLRDELELVLGLPRQGVSLDPDLAEQRAGVDVSDLAVAHPVRGHPKP